MRLKAILLRMFPYIIVLAIIGLGLWASSELERFEAIARAILGLAVFYYAYQAYKYRGIAEAQPGDHPAYFKFPRSMSEVITTLFLAIALSLAVQEVINLVIWLKGRF
jgi:hypothetical protein